LEHIAEFVVGGNNPLGGLSHGFDPFVLKLFDEIFLNPARQYQNLVWWH
jgi:hypothetical protein